MASYANNDPSKSYLERPVEHVEGDNNDNEEE
jgi:hypothetical protein